MKILCSLCLDVTIDDKRDAVTWTSFHNYVQCHYYTLGMQENTNLTKFNNQSVQLLSHVRLFATPWTQHARLPCPSPTPGAYSNSVHQVGDAIQLSHPLSFPSPPAFNLSQHQGLFQWLF